MRVCVVSLKECWRDEQGRWQSTGGFPAQMQAICSLFDDAKLVVVQGQPRDGGIPLPPHAEVAALPRPRGEDARRKLSVLARLPYYVYAIARHAAAADVVHVPPPGDIAALGMGVAMVMRKRLLVRYCGSWEATAATTLMNRVTREWMRRTAGGRNVMLVTGAGESPPGPGMRWVFATAVSGDEIDAVRPDLHRPPGTPLSLCFVGRLTTVKGVDHLIEALALLRADPWIAPRVPHLTIVGDGPERARLAALAERRGCADLVRFTGQLDRDAVLATLLRTDVCVLPSLSEGFCKAQVDAMLCAVPVLSSAVGSAHTIVGADGQRGWIVPPGNARALADSLRRIATEPIDWPALRGRCRAYAEALTLEAWAAQIGGVCAEQWQWALVNGKLRA
jgi:glycosyltransferase involved in cell wall biosynthesis